jgi:hypothetical protein
VGAKGAGGWTGVLKGGGGSERERARRTSCLLILCEHLQENHRSILTHRQSSAGLVHGSLISGYVKRRRASIIHQRWASAVGISGGHQRWARVNALDVSLAIGSRGAADAKKAAKQCIARSTSSASTAHSDIVASDRL